MTNRNFSKECAEMAALMV